MLVRHGLPTLPAAAPFIALFVAVSILAVAATDPATLTQTISDPAVTGSALFGSAAALDGVHLVVGAPHSDTVPGRVFYYRLDSATSMFEYVSDTASSIGNANDEFGAAVDIFYPFVRQL